MPLDFDYVWPWVGIGAAGLLLVLLFATDGLRSDLSLSRWRDLVWLTWAATCAYLIHQFEEHGIDAEGAPYAFRGGLCATLGFPDPAACRIPPSLITAVNIPVVWLAGPLSALLGRRWPAIALSFFAVVFVNALAHVGASIVSGGYNPGVLTAVFLFLPLSLWTFSLALGMPNLGWRGVIATIVAGVAIHAVLLASIEAYLAGWIGLATLLTIQVFNPALPPLIVTLATARNPRPISAAR